MATGRLRMRAGARNTVIRFGADTPAGWGGFAVIGAIASLTASGGAASTHLEIVGGYLVPSAAGAAAHLNGAPYTLTLTSGWTYVIIAPTSTVTIGGTSANMTAQWGTTFNGTAGFGTRTQANLIGQTCYFRTGSVALGVTGGSGTPLRRMAFGTVGTNWRGLVLESDDPDYQVTITDIVTLSCQYITLRNLTFAPYYDAPVRFADSSDWPVTDVIIEGCHLSGEPRNLDPSVSYQGTFTNIPIGTGDGATSTFNFTLDATRSLGGYTVPALPLCNSNTQYAASRLIAGQKPPPIVITTSSGITGNGSQTLTTSTITGTGISSGSVDIATGIGSITFSAAPANGVTIVAQIEVRSTAVWKNLDPFKSTTGLNKISNMRIRGNTFTYFSGAGVYGPQTGLTGLNGVQGGNLVTEAISFDSNVIDGYHAIGVQFGPNFPATTANTTYFRGNLIRRCVSVASDNGNPHQDAALFSSSPSVTVPWYIFCIGNMILPEGGRGSPAPLAFRDYRSGNTGSLTVGFVVTAIGNLVIADSSEGLLIQNAQDCNVSYNTVIKLTSSSPQARIVVGSDYVPFPVNPDGTCIGVQTITGNVYGTQLTSGAAAVFTNNQKVTLDDEAGPVKVSDVFVGPTFTPTTWREALSQLKAKPGVTYGAVGTGVVLFPANVPSASIPALAA